MTRTLFLILLLTGSASHADPMPPLKQLLEQADRACAQVTLDEGLLSEGMLALSHLTHAYMSVGDEASARRVAQRIFGGDDEMLDANEQKLMETTMFVDRVRRTGRIGELPAGLSAPEQRSQRYMLARVFIEQGRFEDAEAQLQLMPEDRMRARTITQVYVEIADALVQGKQSRAALAALKKAHAAVAQIADDRAKADRLLDIAERLAEISGPAAPGRLLEEVERFIQSYERADADVQSGDYEQWSRLGHLHLARGDDAKAWSCYRQTVERLKLYEKRFPGGLDDRPQQMSDLCRGRAAAYLKSGRRKEALNSFQQAVTWLAKQGVTGDPGWELLDELTRSTTSNRFRKLAVDQYQAGDPEAARKTLRKADLPDQAGVYLDLARSAAADGRSEEARALLKHMLDYDDPSKGAESRVELYIAMALGQLALSDRAKADQWFEQARKISAASGHRHHARLATVLIQHDLFEPAYRLTDAIESVPQRALVLAKLAAAIAEQQRDQSRKQ